MIKQGALTNWRWEMEGQVRTQKESNQARHTYRLETVEGGTSQNMETKQPSKVHLLPGDSRERDKSGQGKKATKQGTLTDWRWQREGPVRTRKESDQVRCTHKLEMGEGGISQDTERKPPSKAHSPTGDSRGRDKSGHRKKVTKQGHSQTGDSRGRDKSGQGKKVTKQGTLTDWRQQREGQVRTQKQSNQARCTHKLEMGEGGTSQDTERKQLSKAHSQTGGSRGRDKSGQGKKVTKQGTLTDWRQQREGPVRTWKQSNQARCTHKLEMGEGGTSQNTERKQLSKARSQTGDGRGREKSGHGKKVTKQGALTSWRRQRKGQVRTRIESDQARHTHFLETAEGGKSQDTETKRPSKVHSPTGDGRGRDKSGHGNKATKQGALTDWRRQREGQVRTRKERNQARHTHFLETAEGGTSQDKERK